jgi:hypothetical protein
VILEKPDVRNRLLEYLCSLKYNSITEKQATHTEISTKHSSARIQKLAKNSVDNYKVRILYKVEQKLVCSLCVHPLSWTAGKDPLSSESNISRKDESHSDPLSSLCGRILCLSPHLSWGSILCWTILCLGITVDGVPCSLAILYLILISYSDFYSSSILERTLKSECAILLYKILLPVQVVEYNTSVTQ